MQPLILDGGLATTLESLGAELHPTLWSAATFVRRPELVMQAHRAFADAGAEIVIGASYQMSYEGLAGMGLSTERVDSTLRATVDRAREATSHVPGVRVAASIGPFGAALADGSEYRGDYGEDRARLTAFHRRRLGVLDDAGADWLAIETLPSRTELEVLCELLESCRTAAWVSFSAPDGERLADGTPLAESAAIAARCSRVEAIGVNCLAPERVSHALATIAGATEKPLLAYPNSGERWDATHREWSDSSSVSSLVELAPTWVSPRLWAVGGCCRVGPEEIRELRGALRGGGPAQSM